MPRPFHRSITFWSGILVIAFIGWAWWSSTRVSTFCQYQCFELSNTHGGTEINSIYSSGGFYMSTSRTLTGLPSPALPAPFILRGTGSPTTPIPDRKAVSYRDHLELLMHRRSPEAWIAFIPHWLTLLAFTALWTTLLHRRSKRIAKSTAIA
ncbi:hypothetical protein [Luteolibacter soli]|uniref:Cytochrome c-type biogenesis protein CcmF C-terminal domain-containing protein n=1 Tax=Luteolibacter soli TaxID=3135280 RepID=A0ABU9AVH6_9BACT